MTDQKNTVRFGMVFAGLVFFFNPNINLFDILPDALGALFIYFGLKKAADAGSYFDDARRVSFYMIWLYIVKTAFSFSLLRYPDNALPYTFLSGVLEAIVLIQFFSKLYDGFEYSAMRSGNGATATHVKNVRVMSYIFVICRSFFAFAPEILELLQQNDDLDLSAGAAYRMPIIRLKPYVLLFCVTLSLIVGILYLIYTRSFFARVKKDSALTGYLTTLYRDAHKNDRPLYASRAFGSSLILLAAACVFAADFTLDGFDVLIDLFGVLCVFFAFWTLSRFDGKKTPFFPCALYAFLGLGSTAVNTFLRPTAFKILTASSATAKETTAAAHFFESAAAPVAAFVLGLLYTAGTAFLLVCWAKRAKNYCRAEQLGEYDTKFLSCSVLFTLAAFFKAATAAFEVWRAHLACDAEVAKHLAARSHMSAARFSEAVAQGGKVALFEKIDGIAPFLSLAALALAFFAVISFMSFKAATARQFDPNAEE